MILHFQNLHLLHIHNLIDNLKNTCNNDKVYFHCKDNDRYIEYNMNNQCKFRYVKLDHPPI